MFPPRSRLVLALAAIISVTYLSWIGLGQQYREAISGTRLALKKPDTRLHDTLLRQNSDLQRALSVAKASFASAIAAATAATAEAATAPTPASPSAKQKPASKDGFAYVFYATEDTYACSVLVNIHRLQNELNTTLAIHVLTTPVVSTRFREAMSATGAIVHVLEPPPLPKTAESYYKDSLLKLRAFEMHQLVPGLTRVLAFDADQLIMRNLDHLFSDLPIVDLASPRAYWLGKDVVASTFMLISLSDRLWETVRQEMDRNLLNVEVKYDMDLVNDVLGDTVMMLSGEYVCLNSHWEDWNLPTWYYPERALNMTTIQLINDLARPAVIPGQESAAAGNKGKRQVSLVANMELETTATPSSPSPTTLHEPKASPILMPPPGVIPPDLPTKPASASPSPRFPLTHPLALELERLQDTAAVIHFSAVGKPWMYRPEDVLRIKSDAHPLLSEQFQVWRDIAEMVCPALPETMVQISEMVTAAAVSRVSTTSAQPESSMLDSVWN